MTQFHEQYHCYQAFGLERWDTSAIDFYYYQTSKVGLGKLIC